MAITKILILKEMSRYGEMLKNLELNLDGGSRDSCCNLFN